MADGTEPGGSHDEIEDRKAPAPLKAASLELGGVAHGFFLRTGGVSEGIYASLNCGRGSGDARDRVEENRSRAAEILGVHQTALIGPYQVHSARAVIVHKPWEASDAPEADAIVTNIPNLAVSVLTADCVPVLLADAEAGVVAAVHAGWKGAKAGVIESAIEAMETLGARGSRIAAAIGPAISEAAYEVGPEFKAAFVAGCAENERYFSQARAGHIHFNLPGYVRDMLTTLGIEYISETGVCTYRNESILFSYRRSCHRREPDYGRQISAIVFR
jgi:YfiH family protein